MLEQTNLTFLFSLNVILPKVNEVAAEEEDNEEEEDEEEEEEEEEEEDEDDDGGLKEIFRHSKEKGVHWLEIQWTSGKKQWTTVEAILQDFESPEVVNRINHLLGEKNLKVCLTPKHLPEQSLAPHIFFFPIGVFLCPVGWCKSGEERP